MLHHRRHFIAKVYINMVFIDIIVNTPLPSQHRPHDGHTPSDSITVRRQDTDDGIDRV
jgi:hypothetical protein